MGWFSVLVIYLIDMVNCIVIFIKINLLSVFLVDLSDSLN